MNCRKLEITIVSANDLKDVRTFGRMRVYAEVSIGGEPNTAKKSPVDMEGKTNPKWGFKVEYTLGEKAVKQGNHVDLTIKLYCERSLRSDKYIGEVKLSLEELFKKRKRSESEQFEVKRNDSGDSQGTLNISYNFGERIDVGRPSQWERALKAGAKLIVNGMIFLFLGADVEIPIFS